METLLYLFLVHIGAFYGFDLWYGARGHQGRRTDHFDGERFRNIGVAKNPHKGNGKAFVRWLLHRPKNDWVKRANRVRAKPVLRVFGGIIRVTMVNHATTLIQTNGLNILTDPIWSRRASPYPFFGPKRYREAGIALEDIPPVDIVLISHNHYDHLDIATLRYLHNKWSPKIIVGLGNKAYLGRFNIPSIELDWWQEEKEKMDSTITMVPAQHFSSRSARDRNRTLWGGYVISSVHGSVYFAGDTGYGPFLRDIKRRFDKVTVALLPIGAYIPQFFMGPVHMSPSEAYRAARELNAAHMVPIHYGTFRLADDKQDQPLLDLSRAIRSRPSATKVAVLENGEMKEF